MTGGDRKLDLVNPPEDARAVAQSLSRLGFEVIQGYDLKGTEMTAKLKDFARAVQGADAALFFYAGHGMQVAGGEEKPFSLRGKGGESEARGPKAGDFCHR